MHLASDCAQQHRRHRRATSSVFLRWLMSDWFGCGASWKEDLPGLATVVCRVRRVSKVLPILYRGVSFHWVVHLVQKGGRSRSSTIAVAVIYCALVGGFGVYELFRILKVRVLFPAKIHGTQVPDARIKSWQFLVLVIFDQEKREGASHFVNTDVSSSLTTVTSTESYYFGNWKNCWRIFSGYRIATYMR